MGVRAETLDRIITRQAHLEYMLFLPDDYVRQSGDRWPLILYLHGAQMRVEPLSEFPSQGLPRRAVSDPSFPFVVVAPHCPPGLNWTLLVDPLDALLDEVESRYRVDPDRILLTGLSMGGWGTWHLASLFPRRFAAVVPVCGFMPSVPGTGWPSGIDVLRGVPVWVFHGAEDEVVPVNESRRLVAELKAAGGDVRYTELPGRGHDIWNDVYDRADLHQWLLGKRI